jgi:hypothetical protein
MKNEVYFGEGREISVRGSKNSGLEQVGVYVRQAFKFVSQDDL